MLFFIVIIIIVSFAFLAVISYNSLVQMRNQVRNGWKQIDIQLKRRHDLIPNLVNAVRGQMEFEKETLEKVISARTAAVHANGITEAIKKEGELTTALSKLLAVTESYPDLKSNASANQLMEELTTTENQISFSRLFYNDISTTYNTRLESFPMNLFAADLGFNITPLFQITKGEERKTPVVILSKK